MKKLAAKPREEAQPKPERKYFTAVLEAPLDPQVHDFLMGEKSLKAASWSHAIEDRDALRDQIKEMSDLHARVAQESKDLALVRRRWDKAYAEFQAVFDSPEEGGAVCIERTKALCSKFEVVDVLVRLMSERRSAAL